MLVVENDATRRELVSGALRDEGHAVIGAGSGGHALRLLRELQIDAILSSQQLPDMKGTELMVRAEWDPPDAFVLLAPEGETGGGAGAAVLTPPCDLETLFAVVWRAAAVGRSARLARRRRGRR